MTLHGQCFSNAKVGIMEKYYKSEKKFGNIFYFCRNK